jgi:hypothetical protein
MNHDELAAAARAIIESNMYMTLGTADMDGRPWVSPVYYAVARYAEFYWVSSPDARHSRNLAARPEISIVIFDSQAPLGAAQAVYMSALGTRLTGADLEKGVDFYSRASQAHGGRVWTVADVRPPAPYELYRADIGEFSILDRVSSPDRRVRVSLDA